MHAQWPSGESATNPCARAMAWRVPATCSVPARVTMSTRLSPNVRLTRLSEPVPTYPTVYIVRRRPSAGREYCDRDRRASISAGACALWLQWVVSHGKGGENRGSRRPWTVVRDKCLLVDTHAWWGVENAGVWVRRRDSCRDNLALGSQALPFMLPRQS